MFQRSCVQILAPYTGRTFFTFICCKKMKKRPGMDHFQTTTWRSYDRNLSKIKCLIGTQNEFGSVLSTAVRGR